MPQLIVFYILNFGLDGSTEAFIPKVPGILGM